MWREDVGIPLSPTRVLAIQVRFGVRAIGLASKAASNQVVLFVWLCLMQIGRSSSGDCRRKSERGRKSSGDCGRKSERGRNTSRDCRRKSERGRHTSRDCRKTLEPLFSPTSAMTGPLEAPFSRVVGVAVCFPAVSRRMVGGGLPVRALSCRIARRAGGLWAARTVLVVGDSWFQAVSSRMTRVSSARETPWRRRRGVVVSHAALWRRMSRFVDAGEAVSRWLVPR